MAHPESAIRSQDWNSTNELEPRAIREQLERLLSSPVFSHSKRYPAFLRYVVEQTLAGHAEAVKERSIGIEVFGRDSDYDTNADPIVRVAAGEVRKRLAQYYYEPSHDQEVHIELPVGSYAPIFYLPLPHPAGNPKLEIVTQQPAQHATDLSEAGLGAENTPDPSATPSPAPTEPWLWTKRRPLAWVGIAVVVLLAVLVASFRLSATKRQGFDQFWKQVTEANGSVQFCFGTFSPQNRSAPGTPIMMSSVGTMMRIRDLLVERKKTYLNAATVLGPEPPDLSEFRDGPVIFVGPYMPVRELLEPLRYSFVEENHAIWVRDRQSPSDRIWRTDHPSVPVQQTSESYAIIARLLDRDLRRPTLIVAGVSPLGTIAAGNVLTNPAMMNHVLEDAPPDWQGMNFEAVVKTRVVNGEPGPPYVVATHFWK